MHRIYTSTGSTVSKLSTRAHMTVHRREEPIGVYLSKRSKIPNTNQYVNDNHSQLGIERGGGKSVPHHPCSLRTNINNID